MASVPDPHSGFSCVLALWVIHLYLPGGGSQTLHAILSRIGCYTDSEVTCLYKVWDLFHCIIGDCYTFR